jgi:hypothetical protein
VTCTKFLTAAQHSRIWFASSDSSSQALWLSMGVLFLAQKASTEAPPEPYHLEVVDAAATGTAKQLLQVSAPGGDGASAAAGIQGATGEVDGSQASSSSSSSTASGLCVAAFFASYLELQGHLGQAKSAISAQGGGGSTSSSSRRPMQLQRMPMWCMQHIVFFLAACLSVIGRGSSPYKLLQKLACRGLSPPAAWYGNPRQVA